MRSLRPAWRRQSMAHQTLHRLSVLGLSLTLAAALVGPVLVQSSVTSHAANAAQEEISDFEPFWVMTHRPTSIWSSGDPDAQPMGRVQMWRYLEVVGPAEGDRFPTV